MLTVIFTQCTDESNADTNKVTEKSFNVKTISLSPTNFKEYLDVTGTVKARNQIKLLAEEGGILSEIRRDKGTYVTKGDTIAILENKMLKAGYQEASAALKQAKLDFKSMNILYAKKAISENEFLAAQYSLDRATAARNLAHARYEKLFITAPMNGYVNDRFYDLGAYATPMTPVFEFIDNKKMTIRAGVAERFLANIKVGVAAIITFDAFPDLKIQGRVNFVSRAIDPANRTFNVEIKIDNPDGKLNPQMIANVKLLRQAFENKIVIPIDAIIESENGRYVFIEKDRHAHSVPVSILAVYEDSVLVDGLQPSQHLVVVGQRELTNDDALEIIN